MSEDKNCKITLYLTTPTPLIKGNPFDREGVYGFSGHAFIGITDEQGNEKRWGFGPSNCSKPIEMIKGCEGSFHEHYKNTFFNEAIVYPISREKFDAAQKKITSLRFIENTPYRLFSSNCATVSNDVLKAAGVGTKCPMLAFSPHVMALKKRTMLAYRRVSVALFKAKNKIMSAFGQEKAPESKMLDKLRNKAMPVTIKLGTKTSLDRKQLDTKSIVGNLMHRKNGRS